MSRSNIFSHQLNKGRPGRFGPAVAFHEVFKQTSTMETIVVHGYAKRGRFAPQGCRWYAGLPTMLVADESKLRAVQIWLDRLILVSLVLATFVLGCQQLFDGDTWWHLRSGEWILSHRRVPTLDPFSFASADRPWIDLHWGFQVLVASAYRLGGLAAVILLTATVCAGTILIALAARGRTWPVCLVAAVWIPAVLLMAGRFVPRPEVLSLLFVSAYLAILAGCDQRPQLVWWLVPLQVLWVNVHGLFALGPILLAAYLLDVVAHRRDATRRPAGRVALAWIAVAGACLVNPYGLTGALFPLEILPKITESANPFKAYIAEFKDLASYLRNESIDAGIRSFQGRIECFLLLLLSVSFVLPALWRTYSHASARQTAASPARETILRAAALMAAILILLAMWSLPLIGSHLWLVEIGAWLPIAACLLGLATATVMFRSSLVAAVFAACAGIACGGGLRWLRSILLGSHASVDSGPRVLGLAAWPLITILATIVSVGLTLRAGGRVFRLLLAAAFAYLALSAIRNSNLFALVAGFLIAANLGEWIAEILERATPGRRRLGVGLAVSAAVAGLIIAGTALIAAGVPSGIRGGLFRIGLGEIPLTFAHDAARFAGQPEMPKHALVYDLAQSGVYLFHNAPERKPFMDPRLEIPSRATFQTYVRVEQQLKRGDAGWAEAIDQMGNPLIVLDHATHKNAEGTLIVDPRWRCVYFDAIACVFLPTARTDLLARYPTVSFAARHFQKSGTPLAAPDADALLAESRGLFGIGWALLSRREFTWTVRLPMLLLSADRARESLRSAPRNAEAWLALGDALWNQAPNMSIRPLGPADAWDPAHGVTESQATFAYRRAIELDPQAPGVQPTLDRTLAFRGMADARDALAPEPSGIYKGAATSKVKPAKENEVPPSWSDTAELSRLVAQLLERGRPLAAAGLAREAERRDMPLAWELADRLAITDMHLGDPASARRLWERARHAPSEALRLTRIAEADLAALEFDRAAAHLHTALKEDPRLGEAWFALALLHFQTGEASATLDAARAGLPCQLTGPQRESLERMVSVVSPFVHR